ncbi:MAG TPA: ABC transporter ATP-binding protein [Patescibacteria group bacterium]|nr:ABC transporter ATP-binding protein [Patescibacteria group bacterium]
MPLIEARNVHKVYNHSVKALHVLRGVDLKIEQAAFIALVGPSGAGKSTLLHILGGLDNPSRGEVVFEGRNLYGLQDAEICRIRNGSIGFVFQFYHLLPEFTVLENVLLPGLINSQERGNSAQAHRGALELLQQVGLAARAGHFPAQLSGGEKQRVAIARALVNGPQLLLCDEPTGNLDSANGNEIIALIKRLNKENRMTVVLVTHNPELAKAADHIYRLNDGVLA